MTVARRPAAVAALTLMFIALCAVAGCAPARVSPQARELLDQIDSIARKSTREIHAAGDAKKEFIDLLSSAQQPAADTAKKAEALLLSSRHSEEQGLADIEQMQKLFEEVRLLHSSKELDSYSGMKLDALAQQRSLVGAEIEELDLRAQVLRQVAAGATLDKLVQFEKKIAELEARERDIALKAKALQDDANEYYREKKLG